MRNDAFSIFLVPLAIFSQEKREAVAMFIDHVKCKNV